MMTTQNTPFDTTVPPCGNSAEDSFIKQCFCLDLPMEADDRDPSQIPGLDAVPDLVKKGDLGAAWERLDAAQDVFKDLDFIYVWQGVILQKNRQFAEAAETLADGLVHARQKHVLYDRLGYLSCETGQMTQAVQYWIQSITAMEKTRVPARWEPFLYLAYIARGCGDDRMFKHLMDHVSRISAMGELALEKDAEHHLNSALSPADIPLILAALEKLCAGFASDTAAKEEPPAPDQSKPKASFEQKSKPAALNRRYKRLWAAGLLATALIFAILLFAQFSKDSSVPETSSGLKDTAPHLSDTAPPEQPNSPEPLVQPSEIESATPPSRTVSHKTRQDGLKSKPEPNP